jgi:hypothetical protein
MGGDNMDIVYKNENTSENLSWDDVEFGELCIFQNGCGENFVGMKVLSEHSGCWVVDLSENPSSLYKDGNVYKIVKKLKDATLTVKT